MVLNCGLALCLTWAIHSCTRTESTSCSVYMVGKNIFNVGEGNDLSSEELTYVLLKLAANFLPSMIAVQLWQIAPDVMSYF